MTLAPFGNFLNFLNIMNILRAQILRSIQLGLLFVFCASSPVLLAENPANPSVGKVSLVLGKAWLESPEHGRRTAEPQTEVFVNDRIVTGANGHVHVQFVDNALVSVRPDSRLEIQRYDYDKQAPQNSSVKFRLEEGVTRSISGDAAQSARERFRLNTPIAAIGVRGTDFVVSASSSTTEAMVNEGTIVLAPYSQECSADAFGPCVANAVELDGNSLQMLALRDSEPLPRILPSASARNSEAVRAEVETALAANAALQSDSDESEGAQLLAAVDSTGTGTARATSLEVVQEAITTPQLTSDADAAAISQIPSDLGGTAAAKPKDFTPVTSLMYASLNSRDLLWGRFSFFSTPQTPLKDERITVSFSEASQNREQTLGGLGYHLFRRDLKEEGLQIEQSQLSFKLNSAQAFYNSGESLEAMQVRGGSLDIDLARSQFATLLNLEHSATGAIDFEASGSVRDGGFFSSQSDNKSIAGAISLNGREAGYFFEQQLEAGGIQGLTLWDRK